MRHPRTNEPESAAASGGFLARTGGWCFDHRKRAVALWLVALVVVFGAAGAIGPSYDASTDIPASESADGFDVLDEYFADLGAGGQSGTIVFRAEQGIDDMEVTTAMESFFVAVDAGFPDENGDPQHSGATVISPYAEQGRAADRLPMTAHSSADRPTRRSTSRPTST